MVCVKGQWYIFYHRQTNRQKCARQGCAEPIRIEEDGSIRQAEMTSCGLNGGPLSGTGTYEARIACNLRGAKGTFAYVRLHHKEKDYPYFTQSGTDREQDGDQYIANMQDGAMAGFKYFLFAGENRITVSIRGKCSGKLIVYTENADMPAAEITVSCSEDWKSYTSGMTPLTGKQPLYFVFRGSGSLDFNSFTMTGLGKSCPSTAFPCPAAIADSWDPENAERMGKAIGEECAAYGVDVLLGPALNLKRDPRCGRNFEYFSEDPLLSGKMAASYTRGIQESGTAA